MDILGHAVLIDCIHMAAVMHFAGIFHDGHFPDVAVVQPGVREFNLLAVNDLLTEQAVFIADGAAHGRQVKGSERIQEAGSQTAETAVAQAGFRFFLENIVQTDAEFRECFAVFLCGNKVQHVAEHAAAHEKLNRKIIKTLGLMVLALFACDSKLLHDLIADGGSNSFVNLLFAGIRDRPAIVSLELAENGFLNGVLIKLCGRHANPPIPFHACAELHTHFILYSVRAVGASLFQGWFLAEMTIRGGDALMYKASRPHHRMVC